MGACGRVVMMLLVVSPAAGAESPEPRADPYGELFGAQAAAAPKEARPQKAKPPRPPAAKVVRPAKLKVPATPGPQTPAPVRPVSTSPIDELGLSNHATGRHAQAGP